jgi:hypothetical protein
MLDRYEVTSYLNRTMIGFAEGTSSGLCGSVISNMKRLFNVEVSHECVKVIVDYLENPKRDCWSIHVDLNGEHFESVIVNMRYDTGYEL